MKKILIASMATLVMFTLANAEVERNNSREIKPEIRQQISNEYKNFINDPKDSVLYLGNTGDVNIDNQIKTLRESYITKMKALQDQYKVDLKNIIGNKVLSTDRKHDDKILPTQASVTATTAVNKDHDQENRTSNPKGFFEKLKSWFKSK